MTSPVDTLDRLGGIDVEQRDAKPTTQVMNALTFEHGPLAEVSKAANRFVITGFNAATNPEVGEGEPQTECVLLFQNGSPLEVGVNGLTLEIVMDVLAARLEGYQSGPFNHPKNQEALDHIRAAQKALYERSNARVDRGVEGTHEV